MIRIESRRSWILLAFLAGCAAEGEGPALPPRRVPTSGVVRVDGKPLAGAVVTFNPIGEGGTVTTSDTDKEGHYDLKLANFPGGTAPGRYRVAISYLVTPKGKPVSLSARSSLMPHPDMDDPRELLPPKFSDLGRTDLTVVVPEEGNTKLDFDLTGPLADIGRVDKPKAEGAAAEQPASGEPRPEPPAATEPTATTPSEPAPAPAEPAPAPTEPAPAPSGNQ